MKSFMFSMTRSKPDKGGTRQGSVLLWKIVRNRPVQVGVYNFTFQGDNQALLNAAEHFKLLPKRYFEEGPMGGREWSLLRLREEKVAEFYQI